MKTDDLIRSLAEDTAAEPPFGRRLAVLLPGAAALSLVGLALSIGLRDDLARALVSLPVLRHVLTLLLFAVALAAALRLARPEGRARLWLLLLPAVAGLALLVWSLMSTPADGWGMALQGKTQMACLVSIPLLSFAPVAALMAVLRQGASANPTLSGALAGLAGGGLGAAIYALHCTEDSPLFWVTWYGVAILIVTACSAAVGRRVLDW